MNMFRRINRVSLASLIIPRDMHTHLLPGVDDGRFTPITAAVLLGEMYARGTRHVSLTPHIMGGSWEGATQSFGYALEKLCDAIASEPTPELNLGAEYMIDEALAARVGQTASVDTFCSFCTSGNDSDTALLTAAPGRVLIEMSWYGASPWLFEVVDSLVGAGVTPVLAHPERYPYMASTPEWFDRLHAAGCEFQLNLLSTTGIYGKKSLRIMNLLLERSWYSHVGTDLHSPEQWRQIMNSQMDETTALAGAQASLWSITPGLER